MQFVLLSDDSHYMPGCIDNSSSMLVEQQPLQVLRC